ncbi:hypothetical protein D5S17_32360 [Pseudonocardiaceae bacterium YIM PH 21723]|nr:hypothetical protein D5S17_32360 [Pseudonocardiaceae bacterium YIM PH 21723]
MLVAALTVACAGFMPVSADPQDTVSQLRADGLVDPLGIDDPLPRLSWELPQNGVNRRQGAYQIQAASTVDMSTPDLWDTGKVASTDSLNVRYTGADLRSRQRVFWRVRVWDTGGADLGWSPVARFELGLLRQQDWQARWIAGPGSQVVVPVPAQTTQTVRLQVSRLGLPLKEGGFPDPVSRLQLAEIVLTDSARPTENLAKGSKVRVSDGFTVPGTWAPEYLTDGRLTSDESQRGYSSNASAGQDPASPLWIELDLGSSRRFDRVTLYPRTDTATADGRTPNFPENFEIQVAGSAIKKVTGQQAPPRATVAAPQFAKQFTVSKQVRTARLYLTGIGVYDAQLDGTPLSDAVLQPTQTDYRKRVIYSTYDVTKQLSSGGHTLGVTLGNGIAHSPETPGRYQKFTGTLATPRMLAQLEIGYADGSTATIVSDPSWRTGFGGTTFNSWYGGEDYDARLAQDGWNRPGADLSGWPAAVESAAPAPETRLSAQAAPPIVRIGAPLTTRAISQPKPGVHVFDLGTDIAGWPLLRVSGQAGTKITMALGEQLAADGTLDQESVSHGGPLYDSYILRGGGVEQWHPSLSYHAFRYVQVTGLSGTPSPDLISGQQLGTANPEIGTFSSSNELLGGIHRIIRQAAVNNLFSVPTDCPSREKLGWLEQNHLVFPTISGTWDVAAYYRQFLRTMTDAQLDNGLIPNIAPEYTVFPGAFRDDPNWGSTIIQLPWQLYQSYGDIDTLGELYPAMTRYLNYLNGRAKNNLLGADYPGLGDWEEVTTGATSAGYTSNYGYYRAAQTMAAIATALGRDADAERHTALTANIGAAISRAYARPDRHTYDNGTQAGDALALDMGIVPEAERAAVLDHLIADIRGRGNHVSVGEIGMPALLRVLSGAGRDDVVYDLATQTTAPSYGFQVRAGATALGESWQGPASRLSQSHIIHGSIDAWFTSGLAGIRNAPGSVAGDSLIIQPTVAGDLTHAAAGRHGPRGLISSEWTRSGDRLRLTVRIPAGSTASVRLPIDPRNPVATPGYEAIKDGFAYYPVGSGTHEFTSTLPH